MFCCNFPNCNYQVEDRSLIESHHIKPLELGGCDAPYNLIELCPNHHKLIYIPSCKFGQHSIKHDNSIILLNTYKSTGGRILEYCNVATNEVKMVLIN